MKLMQLSFCCILRRHNYDKHVIEQQSRQRALFQPVRVGDAKQSSMPPTSEVLITGVKEDCKTESVERRDCHEKKKRPAWQSGCTEAIRWLGITAIL